METYGDSLRRQVDDILHTVTSAAVSCTGLFEIPVLVLDDLTHSRENGHHGTYTNRRLHGEGFSPCTPGLDTGRLRRVSAWRR